MKIPKIITKKIKHRNGDTKEHKYKFIKQCNNNLFMYKDLEYGYIECFNKFDLGMVKEIIPATKTNINPEKVKI